MYSTWTTFTLDGITSTRRLQHETDLDALVDYNRYLLGLDPLPVTLEPGMYLCSELTLDQTPAAAQCHQLDHNGRLHPVTTDELLPLLAEHLTDEITEALS